MFIDTLAARSVAYLASILAIGTNRFMSNDGGYRRL